MLPINISTYTLLYARIFLSRQQDKWQTCKRSGQGQGKWFGWWLAGSPVCGPQFLPLPGKPFAFRFAQLALGVVAFSRQNTQHTHTHTFIYKYTIYTYFFCCCFLFYSFCCSFLWLNTKAAGFCASACPACSSSKRLTWCRAGSDKDRERERDVGLWVGFLCAGPGC